jgi:hypothetical protein
MKHPKSGDFGLRKYPYAFGDFLAQKEFCATLQLQQTLPIFRPRHSPGPSHHFWGCDAHKRRKKAELQLNYSIG